MKRKSLLSILTIILIFSMVLTGCNPGKNDTDQALEVEGIEDDIEDEKNPEKTFEPIDINIGFVDGIPALSIAKLAKENPLVQDKATINYELIKGSDLIVSKVMNKELDMAIVPSNLASTAFNKNGDYLVSTLVGFGNLYVVSRDDIASLDDLKGKEITTIGKGLTPDIVLQYVLKENAIDPTEDVTLNYMGGATELAPAFLSKKAEIIVAPEPMISNILDKDPDAKIQFSLNELFAEATGEKLGFPQTALIIKKDLIENHPDLVNSFLNEYKESIDWAIENPEELEKYGIDLDITIPPNILDDESIERMNLKFIRGDEMKDIYMNYINVLFEFQPKTIGGKLPDEGIFFTK